MLKGCRFVNFCLEFSFTERFWSVTNGIRRIVYFKSILALIQFLKVLFYSSHNYRIFIEISLLQVLSCIFQPQMELPLCDGTNFNTTRHVRIILNHTLTLILSDDMKI